MLRQTLLFVGFSGFFVELQELNLCFLYNFNICLLIFFQNYAMQQAFKTMMGQMNSQNNQFNSSAFSPGSSFPFPIPSASGPAAPASSAGTQSQATSASSAFQSSVTVDIPATKVDEAPATNVKDEVEVKNEPKKIGNIQSLLSTSISLLDDMYYLCNL